MGKNKSKDAGAKPPGEFDFPNSASSSSDNEEGEPDLEIEDEEGQEVVAEPCRYMAVKKLTFRRTSSLESPEVGTAPKGTIVVVTHTKEIDAPSSMTGKRMRFRCERGSAIAGVGNQAGWTSSHNAIGDGLLLISSASENRHFVTQAECKVRCAPDVKSADAAVPLLGKGACFEAAEVQEIKANANQMVPDLHCKCDLGWVLMKEPKGKEKQLKTIKFDDPAGDKELKAAGKSEKKSAKTGAKAAGKGAQAAVTQLRKFEDQLNKIIDDAPDNDHHSISPKAVALLKTALELLEAQTSALGKDEEEGE
jgi:hypothetical protein